MVDAETTQPVSIPPQAQQVEKLEKEMHAKLSHLGDSVYRALNHGSDLLPALEGTVRTRPTQQRMGLKELMREIKAKNWKVALPELFAMLLGRQNAIQGVGLQMNPVNIPPHETVGAMSQIEHRNREGSNGQGGFQSNFRMGYLQYELHRSLVTRGYDRQAATATRKSKVEAASISLEQHVPADVWRQMTSTPPTIVGALKPTVQLPVGSWVRLSPDGIPLCVTPQDTPLPATTTFPVYRLRAEANRNKTDEDIGIEYMEQNIKTGDVLALSQDASPQGAQGQHEETWYHNMFETVQRQFFQNSTPHHGTHVMVCNAPGQLLHVTAHHNKQQLTIREMFRQHPYNAVTVVRLPARQEEFVQRVNTFAPTIDTYNTGAIGGMVLRAAPVRRIGGRLGERIQNVTETINPGGQTVSGSSCICTDMVTTPAGQMSPPLQALAKARTPLDIISSPDVRVQFALELGRGAAMGTTRPS